MATAGKLEEKPRFSETCFQVKENKTVKLLNAVMVILGASSSHWKCSHSWYITKVPIKTKTAQYSGSAVYLVIFCQ